MTPQERQVLELDVAQFFHRRWHKSKKTLICQSDLAAAKEVVAYVLDRDTEPDKEPDREDSQRPRIPSR